eukprot:3921908-Prymnesium_polylepis.1
MELAAMDETMKNYEVHAQRIELSNFEYKAKQIAELVRLYWLIKDGASVDPETGEAPRMPLTSDKRLRLGILWDNMKYKGIRLSELKEALSGEDVDAFVVSCKRGTEYTKEEQIDELVRLFMLIKKGASVDPETDEAPRMPVRNDKRLGLGSLWDMMKLRGTRLAELKKALSGEDVDAFVASCKNDEK